MKSPTAPGWRSTARSIRSPRRCRAASPLFAFPSDSRSRPARCWPCWKGRSSAPGDFELRTIHASVAGRIGQVAPVRVGSVVAAGEPLAMVVPQGEIKAIAEFLPAWALGRIEPDQRARVVLQSFPAAQYGDLPATVTRLASEPRDGRIRVELTLRPDRSSRLPLQHGLPGKVEVEVERVSPAVLVLRTVGKVFERPVAAIPEVALPAQACASVR